MKIDVYLLTPEEAATLRACNVPGAQVSPCDYGQGPCIELATLDLPGFAAHRAALEAIEPLDQRTVVEVELEE